MADDRPATPEKQLLKLIENPQSGKERSKSGFRVGPKSGLGFFSLRSIRGAFAGRLSFLKRLGGKKTGTMALGKKISFPVVNRSLAGATAFLLAYLLFDVVASAVGVQRPPNFTLKAEAAPASQVGTQVSPLRESAYYLQKATARDLFKEGGAPVQKAEPKQAVSAESDPTTSGLSLVGISWSANPDVIIEDKNSKRTFFVKRGQVVGQGVKVEAIFKDRVVLSHEGQEFELR